MTNTARGVKRGEPLLRLKGHGVRTKRAPRLAAVKMYRILKQADGRMRSTHRVRAERVLGKLLPAKAIVHHADGSKDDDAPLVICQDQAYHLLLHIRMRVKAAGGDPNGDLICGHCKQVKQKETFSINRASATGRTAWCKACQSADYKKRKALRGAA